jgi:hypothetical protein
MNYVLFLQREPDDFVVVARYGYQRWSALDRDELGAGRELERVGERAEAAGDLVVRFGRREPRFLPHGVLELIEPKVGFAETNREIRGDGENQQPNQAAESACPAAAHH